MSSTAATPSMVLADFVPGARARDLALVGGGAALVGVSAQASFPLPYTPVPVTLQTFAVLVVGATLGARRGAAAMLVYLLAGAAGAPWFSDGSSGWGGASFGYIVGFVIAAAAVGALSQTHADRRPLTTALQFVLGTAIIYLVGAFWLAVNLGVGATTAFELGVRPFLLFDAIKVLVACVAFPVTWAALRRNRSENA